MGPARVAVTYAGDLRDARNDGGKVWFAVDGHAILSRALRRTVQRKTQKPGRQDVKASIYMVPRLSIAARDGVGQYGDGVDTEAEQYGGILAASRNELMLAAAQVNPPFVQATALPPGMHFMCHVDGQLLGKVPTQGRDEAGPESMVSMADTLWAFWEEIKAGPAAKEESERLRWQEPCLELLMYTVNFLGSEASAAVIDRTPTLGWASIPCTPNGNSACSLARGEPGRDGKVVWYHHPLEGFVETRSPLADRMFSAVGNMSDPAYVSAWAQTAEDGKTEVVAEAHHVIPGGVLSGYDVHLGGPEDGHPATVSDYDAVSPSDVDTVDFVDFSKMSSHRVEGWLGTVTIEELPGSGLHRHVRVKIDAVCQGPTCDGGHRGASGEVADTSDNSWCELLLTQHVPEGAYIDVDEVKARHNFKIISTYPARQRVGIDTYGGVPIDVELPASVSGQHVVNFNVHMTPPQSTDEAEKGRRLRAELTLPVHLRYPDPGCELMGEECDPYAWVEVSPPLASIRCGNVGQGDELFHSVRPSMQPVPVSLRVPRGIAWHRDLVVWGTVIAAALGTLLTLWSICTMDSVDGPSRKRHVKTT